MSTQHQQNANRLNAQKSTGPRTPEGKAASSMNALKSGIHAQSHVIKGEDPEALIALTAQYYEDYHPTTAPQRLLVDILVSSEWLLRRFTRIEAEIWELRIEERSKRDHTDDDRPLAESHPFCQESLASLQRRIDSTGRAIHRALQDLRRLQSDQAKAPQSHPEAVSQPVATEPASPAIGFVPQPGLPPAARGPAAPQITPSVAPYAGPPLAGRAPR